MTVAYYVLAFLAMVTNITTFFLVDIRKILALQIMANLLVTASYLCIGRLTGAIICGVACFLLLINFCIRQKGKDVTLPVILAEGAAMVIPNLFVFSVWYDILAILAGIMFVLEISRENGIYYRKVAFFNIVLWLIYNLLAHAWANLAMQIVFLVFNLITQKRDRRCATTSEKLL